MEIKSGCFSFCNFYPFCFVCVSCESPNSQVPSPCCFLGDLVLKGGAVCVSGSSDGTQGGLCGATQGLKDTEVLYLRVCVISVVSNTQYLLHNRVKMVIMPASNNGCFTFPPPTLFQPCALFSRFFRNWRSGLLVAARTVIQLLGSGLLWE